MKKRCVIRTLSGAYVSGWGFLSSNRNEAVIFESFRQALNVMAGFKEKDKNKMWFEPL